MSEYKKLLSFVEDTLNDGNKVCNAIAYDSESYFNVQNVRIGFQRKHREQYAALLRFCADNNLIVVSTLPATLETVVRTSTVEG